MNAKTKLELKSDESLLLGNCIVGVSKFCDDETKEEIDSIVKYLVYRGGKPYSFFTLKQLYVCWSCINAHLKDKILLYKDEDNMKLGKIAISIGEILDAPQEVKWREFT